MSLPIFKLKAAVVHATPVYMDKEATTAKVVRIIKDAGQQGIKLLALPETFIPGYPVSENHGTSSPHASCMYVYVHVCMCRTRTMATHTHNTRKHSTS